VLLCRADFGGRTGAGLVQSVQGQAGGCVLTRSPELITVLDVVEAVRRDAL
jgi:exodeoxyribonuclease V alpha subunit